ncbi:hypothetical protein JCM8547_005065 [Rhodosporidiobolus lusitaniae]
MASFADWNRLLPSAFWSSAGDDVDIPVTVTDGTHGELLSSPPTPRHATVPLPPFRSRPSDPHGDDGEDSPSGSIHSYVRPAIDEDDTSSSSSYECDFDADDEKDERPFPSPRRAVEGKYQRRQEELKVTSTIDEDVVSPSTASKGKHSAATNDASWADPSLLLPYSAPLAPSSHTESISSTHPHIPSKILALNRITPFSFFPPSPLPSPSILSSLPLPAIAAPSTPFLSLEDDLELTLDGFERGRNRFPRLLWCSRLDGKAMEILDAHHERAVGGRLPRLPARREEEHWHGREEQLERRWKGRRELSVEGGRWSRAVEKCGL